ncbi:hypothetical protein [Streptomyces sp. NPDC051677]|uniref:hypothetical protein n=1 Tax=Streptomyces sp. NPDC051677 TaxID=3365669 RepID=UPI0037D65FA2
MPGKGDSHKTGNSEPAREAVELVLLTCGGLLRRVLGGVEDICTMTSSAALLTGPPPAPG